MGLSLECGTGGDRISGGAFLSRQNPSTPRRFRFASLRARPSDSPSLSLRFAQGAALRLRDAFASLRSGRGPPTPRRFRFASLRARPPDSASTPLDEILRVLRSRGPYNRLFASRAGPDRPGAPPNGSDTPMPAARTPRPAVVPLLGRRHGGGRRFGIAVARFNEFLTGKLLEGALE